LLKARKEEKSSTDELPTRFAVEFFFSYESVNQGKRRIFWPTSYIQVQVRESQGSPRVRRAGLSPQEGDVKKKRKKKDQGRQEGGSSEGKVPCALHQEFLFFWFTSILVRKRLVLVEVSAPGFFLRGSNVQRKFQKRTTLCSESSTLKGLLYAPIQRKQNLKMTTLRRLKIPLRSIRSEEDLHYRLSEL
jgi:hypothetical protein